MRGRARERERGRESERERERVRESERKSEGLDGHVDYFHNKGDLCLLVELL